ncbi:MAG: hypothetical protein J6D43_15560, partial [Pseudomonas sp.]|nr:hypothetical protein [Pseudomonas sp.]
EQLLEQQRAQAEAEAEAEHPPEPPAPAETETPLSSSAQGATSSSTRNEDNSSATSPTTEPAPHEQLDPDTAPHADGEPDDGPTTRPPAPAANQTAEEQRQALEQWLRQIPDNPAELLRRKFWYEQQLHQDTPK